MAEGEVEEETRKERKACMQQTAPAQELPPNHKSKRQTTLGRHAAADRRGDTFCMRRL